MPELTLPPRLDTAQFEPLLSSLRACEGPILLNGGAVEWVGGRCLEVLVSARKTALARNDTFAITSPSDALRQSLALLGAEALLSEGAAL